MFGKENPKLEDWQLSQWFKTGSIPIIKPGEVSPYVEETIDKLKSGDREAWGEELKKGRTAEQIVSDIVDSNRK